METILIIGLWTLSAISWYAWHSILKRYNKLKGESESQEISMALEIENLTEELEYARDIKNILERIIPSEGSEDLFVTRRYVDSMFDLKINENMLQYTEDILGGKVIKQEANKCIVIAKDGTVKTGLTKAKVDKGYSYKLVRE